MNKMEGKFKLFDIIRLQDEAPECMRHFNGWGQEAMITGSYASKYGGGPIQHDQYSLLFKDRGEVSWYYGEQMELVRKGSYEDFEEWDTISKRALAIRILEAEIRRQKALLVSYHNASGDSLLAIEKLTADLDNINPLV